MKIKIINDAKKKIDSVPHTQNILFHPTLTQVAIHLLSARVLAPILQIIFSAIFVALEKVLKSLCIHIV